MCDIEYETMVLSSIYLLSTLANSLIMFSLVKAIYCYFYVKRNII